MNNRFAIYARTLTGLEKQLANELRALGAHQVEVNRRSVTCLGDQALLYSANLWCRTAIRFLRSVASFAAVDEKSFYDGIRNIDWSLYLSPKGTLAIDPNLSSSFTSHSLFLAQLTKDAITDQFRARFGVRPSVDLVKPDLRIAVSLFQNQAQIFLDASGESLHRRGYKPRSGEAPLSEVLAAGIIKLSGWDEKTPLLDPMTGSGTLCIEAGLIAKNIAPGLFRERFGFQTWPDYDPALFNRIKEDARAQIKNTNVTILGLEKDPTVAAIARENAKRAELRELIRIECGDFFTWDQAPEVPGTLVMNPPYDERLSVADVGEFYERIGERLKQQYTGWNVSLLSGNLEAIKHIGLRSSKRTILFNGAIESRLLQFSIRVQLASFERRGPRIPTPVENPVWLKRAEVFRNRLRKNFKHQRKIAKREKRFPWCVYEWDVPDLPFVLQMDEDRLSFEEIPRNHSGSAVEHSCYIKFMVKTASEALNLPPEKIHFSVRKGLAKVSDILPI